MMIDLPNNLVNAAMLYILETGKLLGQNLYILED